MPPLMDFAGVLADQGRRVRTEFEAWLDPGVGASDQAASIHLRRHSGGGKIPVKWHGGGPGLGIRGSDRANIKPAEHGREKPGEARRACPELHP